MRQAGHAKLLFLPIAALAVSVLAILLFSGSALIDSFDRRALLREQEVVANGMAGRVSEVAHMVVPQTVWDDAVANLDNRFDREWAQSNIMDFLSETDGFRGVYILDANDRSMMERVGVEPYARLAGFAQPLVEEVREMEARRIRGGRPEPGETLRNPIQASALAAVDGHLQIVSATLVQPDFFKATLREGRAPVVITAMPIDETFLTAFGERFLLRKLQVHASSIRPAAGPAAIKLSDNGGGAVGWLTWRPQRPGAVLRGEIGPWVLGLILALTAISAWLFRRSHRMAEDLIVSEARAAHLAYHDALTGHANRVRFGDRLGQALGQLRRNGPPVTLLCLDLDRFKEINDTYGHQTGDELIKEAARRMAAQCRGNDTFARLSGDEFAIVTSGMDAVGAARLAQRLCDEIARPFEFGSAQLHVGCSIGINHIVEGGVDPAEALRQADIALYRAKETAKGQYSFFEPEMDAAIRNRRSLEGDLRDALALSQLRLVYQPQVDPQGRMTGVEALLRWNHPVRGEISPTFFIAIAEQCGMILEIGMFALSQAFEDSHRWPNLRVAINVSAAQIRDKDFVAKIAALATEKNIQPRFFDLEITEGILLGDDPGTHQRLQQLRQLGFTLALDDIGTGYSSLSYLQRYPINKIKIDRSFVANLGIEAESDAVVSAIINMARALKLAVVAEGVETRAQLAHLTLAGCTTIQGYYFSRPVDRDKIDRMIELPRPAQRRNTA